MQALLSPSVHPLIPFLSTHSSEAARGLPWRTVIKNPGSNLVSQNLAPSWLFRCHLHVLNEDFACSLCWKLLAEKTHIHLSPGLRFRRLEETDLLGAG